MVSPPPAVEQVLLRATFFSVLLFIFQLPHDRPAVILLLGAGAPVARWVQRGPTDQTDRVRSPLEAKSSQP